MIPYDFRCITVDLVMNAELCKLTAFQWMTFAHMQLMCDPRHRLPYEAYSLRNIIFPTRPGTNVGDVAKARDVLLSIGALVRLSQKGKEWMEVSPAFRHVQGREWSYGEDAEEAGQASLPFPPQVVTPPPARGTKRGGKGGGLPERTVRGATAQRAENRIEQTRPDESRAGGTGAGAPVAGRTTGAGETRVRSHGETGRRRPESGDRKGISFARGPEAVPGDEVWRELCELLGDREMESSGAMWLARYIDHGQGRALLREIVHDYRARTPTQRAEVGNLRAWANAEWMRRAAA